MAARAVANNERIVIDPDILVGKPIVRGTRISVELVLSRLAVDLDLETFKRDYPHITREDIQACLRYARDLVASERIYFIEAESAPSASV